MKTDHIVALISRIREQANNLLVAELAKRGHAGLAPSHGAILHALAERGPMPMSAHQALPHIRLDAALEFLLGDHLE